MWVYRVPGMDEWKRGAQSEAKVPESEHRSSFSTIETRYSGVGLAGVDGGLRGPFVRERNTAHNRGYNHAA